MIEQERDDFLEECRMESSRFAQLEHRVGSHESRIIGIEKYLGFDKGKKPIKKNQNQLEFDFYEKKSRSC